MSVNKVILIGNLGRDPEVRYLENQRVVAQFSLATTESFTNSSGERKTETEWHQIETWDNLARITEKYLKKGSQVYIEGKIKTAIWRDKEGTEHTEKKIKAININLLGSRPQATGNEDTTNQPTVQAPPSQLEAGGDLPF
jgi:single-strand DNA-binding protein